jgi:hypothetical protein
METDDLSGRNLVGMRDLGFLLELIHDCHSRVTNFEAEYRDWICPRPSLELQVDHSDLGGTRAHWRGAGPFPKAVSGTRRIWSNAPDCLRIEVVRGGELLRLGILHGEDWWCWERGSAPISGELFPGARAGWIPPPPLLTPPLVDPSRLLPGLRFEIVGSGMRIGRRVVSARALPRRAAVSARGLQYEFDFDAEHGTILRGTTMTSGHIVSVTEAVTAVYDGPMDPEQFVFSLPGLPSSRGIPSKPVTSQAAAGIGAVAGADAGAP